MRRRVWGLGMPPVSVILSYVVCVIQSVSIAANDSADTKPYLSGCSHTWSRQLVIHDTVAELRSARDPQTQPL